MVVSPAAPVRSVNSGEFDTAAQSRYDLKQYYSAASLMKGFEPVPQSGFRLMGGTLQKGRMRRGLNAVATSGVATSYGPHTGTQTVWSATVADDVAAVFLDGFLVSAGTATFQVEIQKSDLSWVAVGSAFSADTDAASRLAAFAPGEGAAAVGVRVQVTFSESATVTLAGVSVFDDDGDLISPRYASLTTDDGTSYSCFVTAGIADFYTAAGGFAGSAYLPDTSAAMVPTLSFYGEAATIGVFHPSTAKTQRIRQFGDAHEWGVDDWPYENIAEVDLGGTYTKTDDVWELFIRWTGSTEIYVALTVDGESAPAIPVKDGGGTVVASGSFTNAGWDLFVSDVKTALEALPGLGSTITVAHASAGSSARQITITFGGDLSGAEYDVSALVSNTASASVLPNHTQIGETAGEPIFSLTRGYPGVVGLVQDRLGYGHIPAKTGALALSEIGEYFNLNIASASDAAARLDSIRSQISETVLAIKESAYLLVFTDKKTYFAPNRTIERNTPLNFVETAEVGIRPNTEPVDMDGFVFYVSNNGEQVISLLYDDVSTKFNPNPESLLASHLISGIDRDARQAAEREQDAAKIWLMRSDGRLIVGQVIRNQDITGYCEWRCADDGLVREIGVDGDNRLWMANRRGDDGFIELYDQDSLFQCTVIGAADLAGQVAGLDTLEGATVYAKAEGYVLGPFTVSAGVIELGDAYAGDIEVGRWIAPIWQSMPQPFLTRNDEIIFRPGRIHTVHANLIDTTSVAIGANGTDARDIKLLEASDPVDAPMPGKTKRIAESGILGNQEGPMAVITQIRPGTLRVRDLGMEAVL